MGFLLLERHSLAVVVEELLQAVAMIARDERVHGSVLVHLRSSMCSGAVR